MRRQEKERVVAEIVERLRTSETLLVADYRGLTHAELDQVRTELLKLGARFAVVKNTLTRRAAAAAGIETLEEFLTGPTAIAFVVEGDAVGVAKVLADTARDTRRLALKGAVMQGRVVDGESVRELAMLPPEEVLRAQLLGAIVGPISAIVGIFTAPLRDLVGVLDARIRQLEEQGAGADATPAPSGEPVADEPPGEQQPADEPVADAGAGDDQPGEPPVDASPAEGEAEAAAEAEGNPHDEPGTHESAEPETQKDEAEIQKEES
jgi:large subunit ribosomal protein L10